MKEVPQTLSIGGVDMTRHDLSRAFGDINEAQYQELVESIERDGVGDPDILIVGTEVLDGWHRCRAAVQTGKDSELNPTPVYSGLGRLDMIKLVAKRNLHRRHMSPQERARAVSLLTSYEENGEIRWETSVREDAETAGASKDTVARERRRAAAEHEERKAAERKQEPPLPGMPDKADQDGGGENVASATNMPPGVSGATPNFGGGGGENVASATNMPPGVSGATPNFGGGGGENVASATNMPPGVSGATPNFGGGGGENVASATNMGVSGATPNFGGGGGTLPPADDAVAEAKARAKPKRGRGARGRAMPAKPQKPVAKPVGSVAPASASAEVEALRKENDNLTDIIHALGGHSKLGEEQRNLLSELDSLRASRDGWMGKHAETVRENAATEKALEVARKNLQAAEKRADKADEWKAKLAAVRKELITAKRDVAAEKRESARLVKANNQLATKLAAAEAKAKELITAKRDVAAEKRESARLVKANNQLATKLAAAEAKAKGKK